MLCSKETAKDTGLNIWVDPDDGNGYGNGNGNGAKVEYTKLISQSRMSSH